MVVACVMAAVYAAGQVFRACLRHEEPGAGTKPPSSGEGASVMFYDAEPATEPRQGL